MKFSRPAKISYVCCFTLAWIGLVTLGCATRHPNDSELSPQPTPKPTAVSPLGGGGDSGILPSGVSAGTKYRIKLVFEDATVARAQLLQMANSEPLRWVEATINSFAPADARDIQVRFRNCQGTVNAVYSATNKDISMCYELVQVLYMAQMRMVQTSDPIRQTSLSLAAVLLHEIGHAAVDLYGISATGNQESSADEFSATFAISYGRMDIAQGLVTFLTNMQILSGSTMSAGTFFDEHPIGLSRIGDVNCLIYGSSPQQFAAMVPRAVLQARAAKCANEFPVKKRAWLQLFTSTGVIPPRP